jgi:hypothetical protein
MTRCLDERELFAAANARLAGERAAHAAGCPGCATRIERLLALRVAARDASAPPAPDWDRIEARVLRSVRSAAAPRAAGGWSFAPAALSFAAAILVALAILFGRQPAVDAPAPAFVARGDQRFGRPMQRVPLAATVAERFGLGAPLRGARVAEDGRVVSGADGGARIALGDDIAVEEDGPASFAIASLDEWRPTIRLDSGAFRIAVADGALPQELVVLAAHSELTVLAGSAEVVLVDGAIELRATDGPLRLELGGEVRELAAGEGLRRGASTAIGVASGWGPLPVSWSDGGAAVAPVLNLDRPTGSLPTQVVRDVLRANTDRIRGCYEAALKRYPGLEALPVTARLRVGTSGRVARTSVAGIEAWPDLRRCIAGVLEGMRFPPPTGGEVDLIAPLRLTPID